MQINMLYPYGDVNNLWDGKIHKIEPAELYEIGNSDYYYMSYKDLNFECWAQTILFYDGDVFTKIPLDDYSTLNNFLASEDLIEINIDRAFSNGDKIPCQDPIKCSDFYQYVTLANMQADLTGGGYADDYQADSNRGQNVGDFSINFDDIVYGPEDDINQNNVLSNKNGRFELIDEPVVLTKDNYDTVSVNDKIKFLANSKFYYTSTDDGYELQSENGEAEVEIVRLILNDSAVYQEIVKKHFNEDDIERFIFAFNQSIVDKPENVKLLALYRPEMFDIVSPEIRNNVNFMTACASQKGISCELLYGVGDNVYNNIWFIKALFKNTTDDLAKKNNNHVELIWKDLIGIDVLSNPEFWDYVNKLLKLTYPLSFDVNKEVEIAKNTKANKDSQSEDQQNINNGDAVNNNNVNSNVNAANSNINSANNASVLQNYIQARSLTFDKYKNINPNQAEYATCMLIQTGSPIGFTTVSGARTLIDSITREDLFKTLIEGNIKDYVLCSKDSYYKEKVSQMSDDVYNFLATNIPLNNNGEIARGVNYQDLISRIMVNGKLIEQMSMVLSIDKQYIQRDNVCDNVMNNVEQYIATSGLPTLEDSLEYFSNMGEYEGTHAK